MKNLIKVGEKFPSVKLFENAPSNAVKTCELFAGKKSVIFGVPGAFTPGCSKTHLPGYITDYDKYVNKGIDQIICVAVNDPFVMKAWGESQNVGNKIRMLADTHGDLARELGIVLNAEANLGNKRMMRFSMVINDGLIEVFNLEKDGGGLSCSLSNEILDRI